MDARCVYCRDWVYKLTGSAPGLRAAYACGAAALDPDYSRTLIVAAGGKNSASVRRRPDGFAFLQPRMAVGVFFATKPGKVGRCVAQAAEATDPSQVAAMSLSCHKPRAVGFFAGVSSSMVQPTDALLREEPGALGQGLIGRICAKAQREFVSAPDAASTVDGRR